MMNLTLDINSGSLLINDTPFDYHNEKAYLTSIKQFGFDFYQKQMVVNDYHKYGGFDVIFFGNIFSVEFIYKDGELYSNSFIYNGLSEKAGFGATEFYQKKDRLKLRKDFKKVLGKSPEKKLKNRDLYIYDWGEVKVSLSNRDYYVFLNFDYY
ncbi:hypothetical protein [Acinetobacter lanii]|uniref:Uncharacterized protein n=1 Tax=Acinetobacter lanii TaxID=2715163 RepID=A0A6G8S3Z3_9GAMM|nr:hypothetical protein [Acinetobacter lanii]QIO08877.1 hypothetical protein G8D99_07510 [Acinetobacter lanii]